MDVWSLFVTLAEVFNANGYRDKAIRTEAEIIPAVVDASKATGFEELKPVAIVDPEQRASAGHMLDAMFNGEGRTTAPQSKPTSEAERSETLQTQPRAGSIIARGRVFPPTASRPSRIGKGQKLPPVKADPWTRMAAKKKGVVTDIPQLT